MQRRDVIYDNHSLQSLAAAVIKQALDDYKNGSASERSMAKIFFDSPSLEYWLSITGISLEVFQGKIDIITKKRKKQYVS